MTGDRDTFDRFQPPARGRFGDNEQAPRRGGPRVTGASDLRDLTLQWRMEKENAIAVTKPGDDDARWAWLPKSQIEYERKAGGREVVVTLPEWLAVEKGLV